MWFNFSLFLRYFSSLEYSADGECLLAGGNSFVICIYHVKEAILLKKFQITQNLSFDGLHVSLASKALDNLFKINLFFVKRSS